MKKRRSPEAKAGKPWTQWEVEVAVSSYLSMLTDELEGRSINKAAEIRRIQSTLKVRSPGSISQKFSNISAVLHEQGFGSIEGFKPRANVQDILRDVVRSELISRPDTRWAMSRMVDATVERDVPPPALTLVEVPRPPERAGTGHQPARSSRHGAFTDYLAREAANATLGHAGELAVLRWEERRLLELGRPKLSSRIDHVSRTRGDGLGYDISSFEKDGRPRLIEVKTTNLHGYTPFYVTRTEVDVSVNEASCYFLYRVFRYSRNPRLFVVSGALPETCELQPHVFRGTARVAR